MLLCTFYNGAEKHYRARPQNVYCGAKHGHGYNAVERENEHKNERYEILPRENEARYLAYHRKRHENEQIMTKLLGENGARFFGKAEFLFVRVIGAVAAVAVHLIENDGVEYAVENMRSLGAHFLGERGEENAADDKNTERDKR